MQERTVENHCQRCDHRWTPKDRTSQKERKCPECGTPDSHQHSRVEIEIVHHTCFASYPVWTAFDRPEDLSDESLTIEERENPTTFQDQTLWPTKLSVAWQDAFPHVEFTKQNVVERLAVQLNVLVRDANLTELWKAVQLIEGVDPEQLTPPPEVVEARKLHEFAGGTSTVTNAGRKKFMQQFAKGMLQKWQRSGDDQESWSEALIGLTTAQRQIAESIRENRFGRSDDDLAEYVIDRSENKRNAIQKQIQKINKHWKHRNSPFFIDREGRHPTKNRVIPK